MRYQRVESKIWHDEKFLALSPMQQRLFFYLLTCPHGNLIGLFVLKPGYAAADLDQDVPSFVEDLNALIKADLVGFDQKANLVWIKNFSKYNSLDNPNQVKAAKKILMDLPPSPLLRDFLAANPNLAEGMTEFIETLPKPFRNPSETVSEPFRNPSETLSKPEYRIQKQNTETETETETEKLDVSAPLPQAPTKTAEPAQLPNARPPTADASADLRANQSDNDILFSCKYFEVTREYLDSLRQDFPALSEKLLVTELKKAADYVDDNKTRFKRRANGKLKNPKLFLRNWLSRVIVPPEQARAPTNARFTKTERNIAVAQAWVAKKLKETQENQDNEELAWITGISRDSPQ